MSSPVGEIISMKLLSTNTLLLCCSFNATTGKCVSLVVRHEPALSFPNVCGFTLDFISRGSVSVWGYTHAYSSSRLIQYMTPEAESHHDQRSAAFCDSTGPYFAQHLLLHLVQLASVVPHLPKEPFHAGKHTKRHKALGSANINVKLCSISLKQLSSKYFCPHLEAERAMGFTLGVVRGC